MFWYRPWKPPARDIYPPGDQHHWEYARIYIWIIKYTQYNNKSVEFGEPYYYAVRGSHRRPKTEWPRQSVTRMHCCTNCWITNLSGISFVCLLSFFLLLLQNPRGSRLPARKRYEKNFRLLLDTMKHNTLGHISNRVYLRLFQRTRKYAPRHSRFTENERAK